MLRTLPRLNTASRSAGPGAATPRVSFNNEYVDPATKHKYPPAPTPAKFSDIAERHIGPGASKLRPLIDYKYADAPQKPSYIVPAPRKPSYIVPTSQKSGFVAKRRFNDGERYFKPGASAPRTRLKYDYSDAPSLDGAISSSRSNGILRHVGPVTSPSIILSDKYTANVNPDAAPIPVPTGRPSAIIPRIVSPLLFERNKERQRLAAEVARTTPSVTIKRETLREGIESLSESLQGPMFDDLCSSVLFEKTIIPRLQNLYKSRGSPPADIGIYLPLSSDSMKKRSYLIMEFADDFMGIGFNKRAQLVDWASNVSFYRVARLDAARVELGKRGGGQWGGIAATPGMLIRYIKRQHPTRRGLLEAAFKAQWGVAWEGLTEEELESMDKYSVMMVEILCGGDRRGLDTNEPERGGNAFLITHRLVFGNPPKPAAEEERRLVLEKKSEPAVEEARGENFW